MLHEISAPPDANRQDCSPAAARPMAPRALRLCDPKPRGALQREGANLADVNGQCFLDLDNTFAILMHRDGFAPCLMRSRASFMTAAAFSIRRYMRSTLLNYLLDCLRRLCRSFRQLRH
ncbi:hypothetical protein [Mesorhizobium sp. 131-3-5]|uniref:hypothetical protein n=1 Tax=Mesorhizobium sp. 131-3-5 TaxID=2744520 RepID=UPI0019259972|nr:hypothetical protein [Mesorhizobium sp. 131-3-5]